MADFDIVKNKAADILENIVNWNAAETSSQMRSFELLSKARKYGTQKEKRRKSGTMTDDERKEERRRYAHNYKQRKKNEVDTLKSKLCSDKTLLGQKRSMAMEMFSDEMEKEVFLHLEASRIINKAFFEKDFEKADIERCIKSYRQQKLFIQQLALTDTNHILVKEYNDSKKKLDEFKENKYEYIDQNSRKKFETEKNHLTQKVEMAALKKNCCSAHMSLQNIERKLGSLQQIEDQLKENIWTKFLKPIDEHFKALTSADKIAKNYSKWLDIKEYYREQWDRVLGTFTFDESYFNGPSFNVFENTTLSNEKEEENKQMSLKVDTENMEFVGNKDDNAPKYNETIIIAPPNIMRSNFLEEKPKHLPTVFPANSKINQSVEKKDLEWTKKRGLVDAHVPEDDNDVMILTLPQSIPPPKIGHGNSESNAKRVPWYGMVDDHMPEVVNEVTVSTSIEREKEKNQSGASLTVKAVNMFRAKPQRTFFAKVDNEKTVRMIRTVEKTNEIVKPLSVNPQIIEMNGTMYSEFNANLWTWKGFIDDHVPGDEIEVKPSKLPQTSDSSVTIITIED